jgi:alanine dehydrogenase
MLVKKRISKKEIKDLIILEPELLEYTENFIKNYINKVKYENKIVYSLINNENINKDLRMMICGDENFINCKILGGIDTLDTTSMDGVNLLFNTKNMKMLSLIDAKIFTYLRTAIINGIALKYLSIKSPKIILFVGGGNIAFYQIPLINKMFPLANLFIFDKYLKKVKNLLSNLSNILGTDYNLNIVNEIDEIIYDADIIITSTPSRKPIIFRNQIKKGVHISALGSDAKGKEEIDPEIIKSSKFVVDDIKQSILYGELNVPYSQKKLDEKNIYATLFEIISGKKEGRINNEEITVFDSTGLSLQDFIIHIWYYEKYKNSKIDEMLRG